MSKPNSARTQRLVRRIRVLDGDNCFYCDEEVRFEPVQNYTRKGLPSNISRPNVSVEHLIDRKYGGRSYIWNVVITHAKCNNARCDMSLLEKIQSRKTKSFEHRVFSENKLCEEIKNVT